MLAGFEHLAQLPDDWDSWLVYADQLIQRGEECGEWLVLEHRGERDEVGKLADERIVRCSEWLGLTLRDTWWWLRKLAQLDMPPAPPDLRRVFGQPISQLATFIDFDGSDKSIPPAILLHRQRAFDAARAWIERAFTEPVPGHGRWQELTDERLRAIEQQPESVGATGFLYFGPAVISFALRRKAANESLTGMPWFVYGTLSTVLYPRTTHGAHMLEQQRQRLAALDREQRRAIYAAVVVLDQEPGGPEAWKRVCDAERDGERPDWFTLFAPPPPPTPVAKQSFRKPATKKPGAKKPGKAKPAAKRTKKQPTKKPATKSAKRR